MNVISWPAGVPHVPSPDGYTESRQDTTARFQPEVGPELTRPRVTAELVLARATLPPMLPEVARLFMDWWRDDLRQGALPFLWRTPRREDVGRWRFTDAPSLRPVGSLYDQISFQAMRLPGTPWWAPYVRPDAVRLPAFVADYENEVFGIGAARVPASDMETIEGTFDVFVLPETGAEQGPFVWEIEAEDIGATAPDNERRIVGFDP